MRQLLPIPRPVEGAADLERVLAMPAGGCLRANFIISADGAVELDGRSGSLGSQADRDAFIAMRAAADVILVGAGTVRAEKYGPVKLDEATRQRRVGRGEAPLPRLAVVSAAARLDPQAKLFHGGSRPFLLTSKSAARSRPDLADVAEVVVCGEDEVDLGYALGHLADLGLLRVLCEGGPTLLNGLLLGGLVDELCLTIAPMLGGTGHRLLSVGDPLPQPARFDLLGLLEADGMLLTRYVQAMKQ
jgi:riboflavin biosynthesis pyrimidine reductase